MNTTTPQAAPAVAVFCSRDEARRFLARACRAVVARCAAANCGVCAILRGADGRSSLVTVRDALDGASAHETHDPVLGALRIAAWEVFAQSQDPARRDVSYDVIVSRVRAVLAQHGIEVAL